MSLVLAETRDVRTVATVLAARPPRLAVLSGLRGVIRPGTGVRHWEWDPRHAQGCYQA